MGKAGMTNGAGFERWATFGFFASSEWRDGLRMCSKNKPCNQQNGARGHAPLFKGFATIPNFKAEFWYDVFGVYFRVLHQPRLACSCFTADCGRPPVSPVVPPKWLALRRGNSWIVPSTECPMWPTDLEQRNTFPCSKGFTQICYLIILSGHYWLSIEK